MHLSTFHITYFNHAGAAEP